MNLRNRQLPEPKSKFLAPPKSNPKPPSETTSKRDVSLNDALTKLYNDISSVPSFSSKIEVFLRNNAVHSKHRRIVKKNFPRRKVISRFPFDLFMADLIEYPQLRYQNSNYRFILIVIDCFTKKFGPFQ